MAAYQGEVRGSTYRDPHEHLSAGQLEELRREVAKIRAFWDNAEVHARFKIEVTFPSTRKLFTTNRGLVEVWESSKTLDGQGDVKVFLCPGAHLRVNDCTAVIPDVVGTGHVLCPACGKAWHTREVSDGIMLNLPLEKWAWVLYRLYVGVGHDADIVLKYHPMDIKTVYLQDARESKRFDDTDKARASIRRAIYPLKNIIKDVGAGADPIARFRAFLSY